MDFLIGLLALFIIATLINGLYQLVTRKPYTCACGWQCYSEEDLLAHILAKNIHKMVE